MAMYGSAYPRVTLTTAQIDKTIKACAEAQEKILGTINHGIAHRLLIESKDFLLSKEAPPPGAHELVVKTIEQLREYFRYHLAIGLLKDQRAAAIAYGGFIGAGECSIVKQIRGTSPEDWKRAATRYRDQFVGGRP